MRADTEKHHFKTLNQPKFQSKPNQCLTPIRKAGLAQAVDKSISVGRRTVQSGDLHRGLGTESSASVIKPSQHVAKHYCYDSAMCVNLIS